MMRRIRRAWWALGAWIGDRRYCTHPTNAIWQTPAGRLCAICRRWLDDTPHTTHHEGTTH